MSHVNLKKKREFYFDKNKNNKTRMYIFKNRKFFNTEMAHFLNDKVCPKSGTDLKSGDGPIIS